MTYGREITPVPIACMPQSVVSIASIYTMPHVCSVLELKEHILQKHRKMENPRKTANEALVCHDTHDSLRSDENRPRLYSGSLVGSTWWMFLSAGSITIKIARFRTVSAATEEQS